MSEMSIVIKGVGYAHPDKEVLFEGLGFSVGAGERVALVGNNGAGKSTLIKIVAGAVEHGGIAGDVLGTAGDVVGDAGDALGAAGDAVRIVRDAAGAGKDAVDIAGGAVRIARDALGGAGDAVGIALVGRSVGEIIVSGRCWYVPQHFGQYDVLTVGQALGVERKLAALAAIVRGEPDPVWFTDLDDDWEIEARVDAALRAWGLAGLDTRRLLGGLSGGEKTKVYLAGIAIHDADIVFFDEPSNHLDASSRLQLYELVEESGATMLIVSHDRVLLNMVDRTLELSGAGLESYGGNYEFYRAVKEGKLSALQAQLDEQQKALRQSRQKAREMMQQRQKREARGKAAAARGGLPRIIAGGLAAKAELSTAKLMDTHTVKMSGISGQIDQLRGQIDEQQGLRMGLDSSDLHRGKVLVHAEDLCFGFGAGVAGTGTASDAGFEAETGLKAGFEARLLWEPLSFEIRSGDRLRIVGDNGSGKTTLLRLITGELAVSSGSLYRAAFGYLYLDQDYSIIDSALTVYQQVQRHNSRHLQEHELKSLLVHFQFQSDAWDRSCAALSGGEKLKLALACMSAGSETYDVLLLDEPTNNLDMMSLDVLTAAVRAFTGTLIVISHDQYFADAIDLRRSIEVKKPTV